MSTRLGVDIGGTFTDLIFYDDTTGAVRVGKAPTTPQAPELGVMQVVTEALSTDELARAEFFMHGTTIGLNALLQRSGAVTGLICTHGFRDTLEIRRADRGSMYDLQWQVPEPFVPRRLRRPVRGRLRADGLELEPINAEDVSEAVSAFQASQVSAVAVCTMNAYADPVHELELEALLRAAGYEGDISLSHRLTREYREYERTSTTVIDAYIRGATSHYLNRLTDHLRSAGFQGEVLIMRSGGGVLSSEEASQRPFEAIQSGPVGGAEGAATLSRSQDWPLTITADVGGTSFDTSLITRGRPRVRHEGQIAGWPVLTPWVDVNSIGAGGGSIAFVEDGMLRVGPRSAGAVPGPACYGRGGTEATVTDAALLLGLLGDGSFASGLELDKRLSESAFQGLSDELGLTVENLARGVMQIATAAMAGAIREITVGQGEDPREAKLVAFGGAGPMFATLLATELGIRDIVVPEHAGNFSAWGLIGQDRTYEAARTLIRPWAPPALVELNACLTDMLGEIAERQKTNGDRQREHVATFELRYAGQDHAIPVKHALDEAQIAPPSVITTVTGQFREQYERRFGMTLEADLELVTVRCTARELLPLAARVPSAAPRTQENAEPSMRAFSFQTGAWQEFALVERSAIGERSLDGPMIVKEHTTTTYVDVGFQVGRGAAGELLITDTDAEAH